MRNHRRIIAGEEISRYSMGEHERGIKNRLLGCFSFLFFFFEELVEF